MYFAAINCLSGATEVLLPNVMMLGFGISLSVTLFYITIRNPLRLGDNQTGAMHAGSFDKWMKYTLKRKKILYLIIVDLHQLHNINQVYGSKVGSELLLEIVNFIKNSMKTEKIFRISSRRIVAVTPNKHEFDKAISDIYCYLSGK